MRMEKQTQSQALKWTDPWSPCRWTWTHWRRVEAVSASAESGFQTASVGTPTAVRGEDTIRAFKHAKGGRLGVLSRLFP
jgi:hypothetical protein